eukprot:TRINITY_DN6263_c0_g1_i5.p1 TRINITY_DN6263_c0_g1~~TRINITY_DN6263_c0_g1_i5.p1  ORF type:complete len:189 (-),score=43.64 TRINITY_DN6263_c0_g1_i5:74-640(-)
MDDPGRRKIHQSDLGMRWFEIARWLDRYPQYREHFDESIHWSDVPYHNAPESLPADMRPGKVAPKPGENTLLEDLDYRMSDWAQEMLDVFWLKADLKSVEDPAERKRIFQKANAAAVARDNMVDDLQPWVHKRMMQSYTNDPDTIPQPYTYFEDGAQEILSREVREKPFCNPDLETELSNLFRKVSDD